MSDYFEKNDHFRSEGESRRDGFSSHNRNQRGEGRPRFSRPAGFEGSSSGYRASRGGYSANEGHSEGGYRPRFNQGEGHPFRPRFQSEGGEQGYRPRPAYNSENRFNKRPYGSNSHFGSEEGEERRPFRPRFRNEEGEQGYRPRPAYNSENRFNKRPYGDNSRFGAEEGGERRPFRPRFGGEEGGREGFNTDRRGGFQRQGGRGGYNKYSQKKRIEYKEQHYDPNEPVRLNKFLANAGVCSRRDADKYIEAGVVTVNGNVVTELGTKVLRTDTVLFHDEAITMEKKVYVLLNKPKDYVTTSEDPQNRKTVMDLVRNACPERIYPVGRLDRNTTGVLLLTNDGEMASKLTHPKFLKKKIYHVFTDQNVTAADMRQIAEGIMLEDGEIKADAIEYVSDTDKKQIGIEIHSGKNRIVRRIFEHLGYHVIKLDRVYFAGLTKKNVRRGDWRYLTETEVNMLRMGAFE